MDSFFLALNVVFPLFIYMVVGLFIKSRKIMTTETFKTMNTTVFRIFIPLSLFFSVYDAEILEVFRIDVFGFAAIGILVIFCVSYILVFRVVKDRADAATIVQGIYRSNYVLFGGAVAAPLCKENGLAIIGALASFVVPLINMLAVILFESVRGGKINIKNLLISIIKNPLVEAGLLGIIFSAFHLRLPELIETPLSTLGTVATPLALVILGGLLSFESVLRHRTYLIITTVGRLLVVPTLMVTAGVLLGLRGDYLAVILSVFGAPTAVASAPMAQSMGGNGELAGEIVASTTAFSVFTIFIFVFVLAQLHFI